MRVFCPHCQSKATITNSNRLTDSVKELYCHCDNTLCDAGFVMTLSHKHDTRPPRNEFDTMVVELVRQLSPDVKRKLARLL